MKHAVVTGGASGLGLALATRLHGDGWAVDLWDRDVTGLESALAGREKVTRRVVDVRSAEEVRRAFEEIRAEPSLVFHAAGVCHVGDLETLRLEECRLDMEVNYFGTVHLLHAAASRLRPGSHLICVASVAGLKGLPEFAAYGATKFAVQGLYDSLRLELGRDGVHVGVVSPGFVDTPLRDHVLGPDGKVWAQPPDPPFRIWPVEKCVDRIVRLIIKRRARALLPALAGPLLTLDHLIGGWIGDWILASKCPPESS